MKIVKKYINKKGQYLVASNYKQDLFLVKREIHLVPDTFILYEKGKEVFRIKKYNFNSHGNRLVKLIGYNYYITDTKFNNIFVLEKVKGGFGDIIFGYYNYYLHILFKDELINTNVKNSEIATFIQKRFYSIDNTLYSAIMTFDKILIYKNQNFIKEESLMKGINPRSGYMIFESNLLNPFDIEIVLLIRSSGITQKIICG